MNVGVVGLGFVGGAVSGYFESYVVLRTVMR